MILRKFLPALSLLVLLFTSSCIAIVAGGAGAGGYIYGKGGLKNVAQKPLGRCFAASKNALAKLGLPILKTTKEPDMATIISRFSDDKRITITIKKIDNKTSEIEIRVGVIGDEQRANHLMKNINQHLDLSPTSKL